MLWSNTQRRFGHHHVTTSRKLLTANKRRTSGHVIGGNTICCTIISQPLSVPFSYWLLAMNSRSSQRIRFLNRPKSIIGMQTKQDIPEPMSPTAPVQRRPSSLEFIMNAQTMYAGISSAPDTNAFR